MPIRKLVIDRSRWGMKSLLNEDGYMCCLGFLAIACGALPDEIRNECEPSDVPNINWPPAFIHLDEDGVGDSDLALEAMDVNDSDLTWKAKERELIKIFKRGGITLTFKGKRDLLLKTRV